MANRAFVKYLPVPFWTFQDFKDGDGPRPLIDPTYKPRWPVRNDARSVGLPTLPRQSRASDFAGIRDARTDFGIQCILIAAIKRMGTPELGFEMVQTILAHPREEVVGIGMDYAEADNPPEKFWKAYRLAGERGLRRTAHASEDAPARNVETCLDLLGCERIDHGYHVIEDERITKRCADHGVVFSCCPRSTAWVYFGKDLTNHPIREMARRGLKIMVDCDDPPMFKTDPTSDYVAMAEPMGFGPEDVREFVLNGIDGSWLDDPTKRRWRREWSREIDALIGQLDNPEPMR
jgi:adenosine deaminase